MPWTVFLTCSLFRVTNGAMGSRWLSMVFGAIVSAFDALRK
jgi:hypothetical protein